MRIGLITDSLGSLPFESALDVACEEGLVSVEVATGNWSTAPHIDLDLVCTSATARDEFVGKVADRGLSINAFNANGNQLHPVSGPEHDRVLRASIDLASKVDVPTVVCMSGLPAPKGSTVPNWVTVGWPPENLQILEYQWTEVALPYWKGLAQYARERGVRLAIEACFSQLVYSASTMLRLIESAGADVVGANLDPSHLMWMGADIPTVIRALGESIIHVHAKDVRINTALAARDGVLDTHGMSDASDRAWNYVSLGLGHPDGEAFWANFVYDLRGVGYDGAINIEHEDILVNSTEGVRRAAAMLRRVVPVAEPDWKPADV